MKKLVKINEETFVVDDLRLMPENIDEPVFYINKEGELVKEKETPNTPVFFSSNSRDRVPLGNRFFSGLIHINKQEGAFSVIGIRASHAPIERIELAMQ